jgi:hypothetical protein
MKTKIETIIATITPTLIELLGTTGVNPTACTVYEFTGYEEI